MANPPEAAMAPRLPSLMMGAPPLLLPPMLGGPLLTDPSVGAPLEVPPMDVGAPLLLYPWPIPAIPPLSPILPGP